jgi:hypothetical protein
MTSRGNSGSESSMATEQRRRFKQRPELQHSDSQNVPFRDRHHYPWLERKQRCQWQHGSATETRRRGLQVAECQQLRVLLSPPLRWEYALRQLLRLVLQVELIRMENQFSTRSCAS